MTELAVDLLFGHVPQLGNDVVHLIDRQRRFVLEARLLNVLVRGLDRAQAKTALRPRETHEVHDARLMVVFHVQFRLENKRFNQQSKFV